MLSILHDQALNSICRSLTFTSKSFTCNFRQKTLACALLDDKEDDDGLDYRLPLSQVLKSSLEEVKHQNTPFSAIKPKIIGFREHDYQVSSGFEMKPSKLDDNITLLAKAQSKIVVSTKYIEELERLTRQAIAVASHSEWTLGSAVVLMQKGDKSSAIRSLQSVGLAQSHSASLLTRLLSNLTHVRREQFLSVASLSSSAKANLADLPIPLEGCLFQDKLADTISQDANTSSNQALVSIASKLQSSSKNDWKLTAKSSKSSKSTKQKEKSFTKPKGSFRDSFRGKSKEKKNKFENNSKK